MTFVQFPFSLLRCPYCHNDLKFTSVPQPDQNVDSYGILGCGCYKYPVIDGVPVIRKEPINVQAHVSGPIQIAGPTPDFLASLILQRKGQEALLRIITFPWFPSNLQELSNFAKNLPSQSFSGNWTYVEEIIAAKLDPQSTWFFDSRRLVCFCFINAH